MDVIEPKKLALLRQMQILQKYSDPAHPMTQEQIAGYLREEYGLDIERKAVSRNISTLREAGFEIVSCREGSYINSRDFTDSELRVLIDGVLSSKYISAKYSKDLINKLCGLSSKHFRSHVKHVHSVQEWEKTENPAFFFNIEMVDEAIEQKKQIRFDYNKYGIDKKLHKTFTHQASPYQLILHNQRYYLMARNEQWKNLSFYRLDRITNMTLTEEKLVPINKVEGFRDGIDYRELSTALPYMYTDKPEMVEFVADESVIDQIIDWFGRNIFVSSCGDGKIRVSVKVSPMAMEHWAMQYAGYVTVTSPQTLVDSIKKRLQTAAEKYGG
ncbi:MAG: WYL domain-containing transcriptional regulator [Clostridia bacterium]|nr:WYL domain-containing transcriptional regulator [Clostridia bacterium]